MYVEIEIQMYMADIFRAIVNKKYFELQLKNCDLGNETFVIIKDVKNNKIMFNPKHVTYIKYLNVLEVANNE